MGNATLVSSERFVNPKTIACSKCRGTGRVNFARAAGRCFACGGSGWRRDRTRVVREVRHTFFVPEGMEINLMLNTEGAKTVPSQAHAAVESAGDRETVSPVSAPLYEPHLVGLPWVEQARIRAVQRS